MINGGGAKGLEFFQWKSHRQKEKQREKREGKPKVGQFKQTSAHRITDNELKQQLEVLRNEKKQLKKEVAETRERLQQTKAEKEAVARAEEQCKRERAALLRKIEMVAKGGGAKRITK